MEEPVQKIGRLNVEDSADALRTNLRSKQILNAQNEWNYHSWDHQAECLRPTKQEALSFARVRETLTLLTRLGANTDLIHRVAPLFFARVETPCVQRLHRSSYASEVRVTSQVEVQKKPDKQHNQTKQDHQTTPTQKRPQQKTATWYVAQATVSAK